MRKVTEQIKQAFFERKAKTIGNTHTDGESVWLHGNEIIKRDSSGLIFWTLAGWNTPTTRVYRNPNFTEWYNITLFGKVVDNARTHSQAVAKAERLNREHKVTIVSR